MQARRPVLLGCLLVLGGCHSPRLETIDQSVADFATRPFDLAPVTTMEAPANQPTANAADGGNSTRPWPDTRRPSTTITPVVYSQVEGGAVTLPPSLRKFQLNIPADVPGAEAPLVKLPAEPAERQKTVDRLYPDLPPLPEEPTPQLNPNGRPYTLADLQQLAAANSPQLRQAASDVQAARGNLDQARAYPNPTVGLENGPNNNNTATGTYGMFVDQVVKTGGKLKLQSAAAEKDLHNAELALKRARGDLATQVRSAYYNLIVAKEAMRVNTSLAHFTDEIFRLQSDLLRAGQAASHEPAALRAQAATIRLAYKQSIVNYVYAWKQMVATIGLPQLPLSDVEGRVDRLIPGYDYDTVLAHVLRNHTDVLTAKNTLEKARYTLQLAQITPVPDVEVRADVWKEFTVPPFNTFQAVSLSVPLPVWDQNRGPIRTAAAGLVRASEEPHRVEVTLTNGLAAAYATYQENLDAVEYYRRDILPDLVRYYRGVFERRKIDPNAAFADLVTAQQTLTTNVTAYLGVLGQLWASAVTVADFLQTDDLYQLGKPLELPELPDIDACHAWPCPHPQLPVLPQPSSPSTCPTPAPQGASATLPELTIPTAHGIGKRSEPSVRPAAACEKMPPPDEDRPDRSLPLLGPPPGPSTVASNPPTR
jgi:cobalt-zinc-cadmium efflux system outer membrane protein